VFEPEKSFEYTSGCPLSTPSEIMVGTYENEHDQWRSLRREIPAFSLDSPYDTATIN